MKIFSTVFGLIILVLVLSFALSNKQEVTVGLWPLPDPVTTPLYAIGLAPLAFGFVAGSLWGWLTNLSHRMHARKLLKEMGALNEKIGELQKNATVQNAKAKVQPSIWKLFK